MSVSVTQPELLTPTQVAEKLKVDVQLLNQWRSARKGPRFVKLGRFIRYKSDELQEWIDAQGVDTNLKLV
ncbi:MAG: DNA-binding protein [Hyphomicrobiaceae bacterium]|nr:MAG: DNA-binding protein [Hyphomicrobiaceae bacterium]